MSADRRNMRLSDEERQDAMDVLGEHVRTGRLDIDEFGTRSAKVSAAKTVAELAPLFEDLPSPQPSVLVAGISTPIAAPATTPARWLNVSIVPVAAAVAIGLFLLLRGSTFLVFLLPLAAILLFARRR